jgi:deazaflavin-dependent oxidoreductase (nitroreductase family)
MKPHQPTVLVAVNKSAALDPKVTEVLSRGGVVDITTTGLRSGQPRRIEIVYHNLGGRIYISGMPSPRKRKWLANLEANPQFTLHLKRGVVADLPAEARVITDEAERRALMPQIAKIWKRNDADVMVDQSPLIEVNL